MENSSLSRESECQRQELQEHFWDNGDYPDIH